MGIQIHCQRANHNADDPAHHTFTNYSSLQLVKCLPYQVILLDFDQVYTSYLIIFCRVIRLKSNPSLFKANYIRLSCLWRPILNLSEICHIFRGLHMRPDKAYSSRFSALACDDWGLAMIWPSIHGVISALRTIISISKIEERAIHYFINRCIRARAGHEYSCIFIYSLPKQFVSDYR